MVTPARRSPCRLKVSLRRPPGLEALESRWCPALLLVDDDLAQRPDAGYTTITAALAAARSNDIIAVYEGTYNEQLTITRSGVQIVGRPSVNAEGSGGKVRLQAPQSVTGQSIGGEALGAALIDVVGARNVQIQGLTLDASTGGGAGLAAAVRVLFNGSATVVANTVTGAGVAVQVGTSRGTGSAAAATVVGNTVSGYRDVGVLVDGDGAWATVAGNTITGRGGAAGPAQYGVQVSRSATAFVEDNVITANAAGRAVVTSAGVYFYDVGGRGGSAVGNLLQNNGVGVLVESSEGEGLSGVQVSNNDVSGSGGYAAILVMESSRAQVLNNQVYVNNPARVGIAVVDSHEVVVRNNIVRDNSDADGILLLRGGDHQVSGNEVYNNGGAGIAVRQSNDNAVFDNRVYNNGDSGVEVVGGGSNDIRMSEIHDNGGDGVLLQDTTGNTVAWNRLYDNGGYGARLVSGRDTHGRWNEFGRNAQGEVLIDANSDWAEYQQSEGSHDLEPARPDDDVFVFDVFGGHGDVMYLLFSDLSGETVTLLPVSRRLP